MFPQAANRCHSHSNLFIPQDSDVFIYFCYAQARHLSQCKTAQHGRKKRGWNSDMLQAMQLSSIIERELFVAFVLHSFSSLLSFVFPALYATGVELDVRAV